MERTPEPELMVGEEQALAYAQVDFSEPHNRFVALLRESLPSLPRRGVALELGCGPGDIMFRFARAFPQWTADGIDASEPMLRLGRVAARKEGLDGRVAFVSGYLPDAAAPRAHYDLVFSNGMIHHLRDAATHWRCVRRWAPAGAAIFAMDLVRPESSADAQRLVDAYATGEPDIFRQDFFNSLLASYRVDEIRQQLDEAGLGYLDARQVSDRHWAVSGTRR